MKRIWIVNYYATPPEYAYHPRHINFSSFLMDAGFDVTIISSSYLHHKNKDLLAKGITHARVNYGRHKFFHIKVLSYRGNGIKRMISIFQFAYRLFLARKKIDKPDIVFHNLHVPFDVLVYWCARKLKAKYIAEVWDLWPESFVWFGLINKNNPLLHISYQLEKRIYKSADKIVFSLEGGIDYIIEKGWDISNGGPIELNKIHYINNGVDLAEFNNNINKFMIQDDDLCDDQIFRVIYVGSISLVNNIRQLVEAAVILDNYTDVKILIYGDGTERLYLENYCIKNNIRNVMFKQKWVDLKYIPYLLSRSSLNILNYRKNFGLYGTSSGKLFQYLASGKPILSNNKMRYCLIARYNLGISDNIGSSQEYASAIMSIKNMDKESYDSMCNRVKEVAKQYDYKILNNMLLSVIYN